MDLFRLLDSRKHYRRRLTVPVRRKAPVRHIASDLPFALPRTVHAISHLRDLDVSGQRQDRAACNNLSHSETRMRFSRIGVVWTMRPCKHLRSNEDSLYSPYTHLPVDGARGRLDTSILRKRPDAIPSRAINNERIADVHFSHYFGNTRATPLGNRNPLFNLDAASRFALFH